LHDVADDDDDVSYVSEDETVCGSEDVNSQHEIDVEFDNVNEVTPFLAADDANADDVTQAESVCEAVDVGGRCLDVGVQLACNVEFRDADVDETTADEDCHFSSGVQFAQPADLSKVSADSSQHSIHLYLTHSHKHCKTNGTKTHH